jgi:hypothetical protein
MITQLSLVEKIILFLKVRIEQPTTWCGIIIYLFASYFYVKGIYIYDLAYLTISLICIGMIMHRENR